jgi:hypothetical protein
MARPKSSRFSVRLQVRSPPLASISVNDSTSPMMGRRARPRPWMLAPSAPPRVRLSAPVCFWTMPQAGVRPCCRAIRPLTRSGHWIPASASTIPRSTSSAMMRCIGRVSSRTAPVANCWPPMACRPPATQTGLPSRRAAASAASTADSESTATTRSTLVPLSFECRSLTWTPAAAAPDEDGASARPAAVPVAPRRN